MLVWYELHFCIVDALISVNDTSFLVADGGAVASAPIRPSNAVKGSLKLVFIVVTGVVVYIGDAEDDTN